MALPSQRHTPVLIVGGGPVGLTLALCFKKQGVPCLICDKFETPAGGVLMPKGQQVSERTMEIWRSLDPQLPDEVRGRQQLPDWVLRGPTVRALHLGAGGVLEPVPGEAWQGMVPEGLSAERAARVPQGLYEELLRARLTAPVECLFGWEVTELQLHCAAEGAGGRARLRRAAGGGDAGEPAEAEEGGAEAVDVHFDFVVGCDGGRSLVRRTLGIEMEGPGALAEATTVVFRSQVLYGRLCEHFGQSVAYNIRVPGRAPAVLWLTGGTELFYGSIMGDCACREGAGSPDDLFDARGARPGAEQAVMEALRAAMSMPFDWDAEPVSTYRWKPYCLVAERFGFGCAFIAGDAAHLMSPAGGQGMNTGIGDAFNLGWKLGAVLQGWASPALLETYSAERCPLVRRNVGFSTVNTGAYQSGTNRTMDPIVAAFGDSYAQPQEGAAETAGEAQLALPPWEKAKVGCRCPEISEEAGIERDTARGGCAPLLPRVSRVALTVLIAPDVSQAPIVAAGEEAGVPLAVIPIGPFRRLAPVTVVRPDHFVAWCGEGAPTPAALRAIVGR